MLRVTIELVPHGDESRTETLETVVIGQVDRLDDDPQGLRGYMVRHRGRLRGPLIHRRSDGAIRLVRDALNELEAPRG